MSGSLTAITAIFVPLPWARDPWFNDTSSFRGWWMQGAESSLEPKFCFLGELSRRRFSWKAVGEQVLRCPKRLSWNTTRWFAYYDDRYRYTMRYANGKAIPGKVRGQAPGYGRNCPGHKGHLRPRHHCRFCGSHFAASTEWWAWYTTQLTVGGIEQL